MSKFTLLGDNVAEQWHVRLEMWR